MNREQLIVELTKMNPNENRQDVENELMPLIDEYAQKVATEEVEKSFGSDESKRVDNKTTTTNIYISTQNIYKALEEV